jgi:diketogulonate reductase-like aldo/keto reductase
MADIPTFTRRGLLTSATAVAGASVLAWPTPAPARQYPILTKPIPSSGEALPVVGLGTWITFNVGNDPVARDSCAEVMGAFFAAGGRMIDSSPMYGSSQPVIGYGLGKLKQPQALFSAEKVWISSAARGPAQIEASRRAWNVPRFDLLQVHNLLSWEAHLRTLFAMKAEGQLRYVGITTSEGRRAGDFAEVMRRHPLDFIQVTYNPVDREVEARILPLARERGMAVIINRPFQEGDLTKKLARHRLPEWAAEIGCTSWAQVILKFIASHPAVTCAIPATTRVDHVRENMAAAGGVMPDEAMRGRIAAHIGRL